MTAPSLPEGAVFGILLMLHNLPTKNICKVYVFDQI